jgi:tRNA 5-methylaminomethyl-2-thiouridine biosynthesis bifunctional protein
MVTRTDIAVIGAGLAGAACARALARAGFRVTVFEAQGVPASGASGNPIAILHPLVSSDHNLASQWVGVGMKTTLRWLSELGEGNSKGSLGQSCGVAQLNRDASDLVHWTADGAWIRPTQFVKACLSEAIACGAQVIFNQEITALETTSERVSLGLKNQSFDAAVVCTAQSTELLLPQAQLMLNALHGTVTSYSISQSESLPCVICADGYATPVIDGQMVVGASYERGDDTHDKSSNLDRLRVICEPLAALCAASPSQDRRSTRSASLDRMPHVGRVLDANQPLKPSISQIHQMPRHPRLWVLGGLGSRGFSSAPLGAEIIVAQMRGVVPPVGPRLLAAVDPVRFALRRHQRRSPC